MHTFLTIPTTSGLRMRNDIYTKLFMTSDGAIALRVEPNRPGWFDYVVLTGNEAYSLVQKNVGDSRRADILPLETDSLDISTGSLLWHAGPDIPAGSIYIDQEGTHIATKADGGYTLLFHIDTGERRWAEESARGMVANRWTLTAKNGGVAVLNIEGAAVVPA